MSSDQRRNQEDHLYKRALAVDPGRRSSSLPPSSCHSGPPRAHGGAGGSVVGSGSWICSMRRLWRLWQEIWQVRRVNLLYCLMPEVSACSGNEDPNPQQEAGKAQQSGVRETKWGREGTVGTLGSLLLSSSSDRGFPLIPHSSAHSKPWTEYFHGLTFCSVLGISRAWGLPPGACSLAGRQTFRPHGAIVWWLLDRGTCKVQWGMEKGC